MGNKIPMRYLFNKCNQKSDLKESASNQDTKDNNNEKIMEATRNLAPCHRCNTKFSKSSLLECTSCIDCFKSGGCLELNSDNYRHNIYFTCRYCVSHIDERIEKNLNGNNTIINCKKCNISLPSYNIHDDICWECSVKCKNCKRVGALSNSSRRESFIGNINNIGNIRKKFWSSYDNYYCDTCVVEQKKIFKSYTGDSVA